MAVPPDVAFLKDVQHRVGMLRLRDKVGVGNVQQASFHKIGDVRVPVPCKPLFPSCLWRPWAKKGHQFLSDSPGGANPEFRAEKVLRTAEDTSHRTTTRCLDDLARVIEFFV